MDTLMLIIGIIVLVVIIIVIIGIIVKWLSKKRREAIEKISLGLGFSYESEPQTQPHLGYTDHDLFNIGRARKGYNMMRGGFQGTQFEIFDYRYTIGGGKHARNYYQTVAIANVYGIDLPHFTLGPDSFYYKDGRDLGKRDIKFESHRTFSDTFLLEGDDENRIRQIFNAHTISNFEGMTDKISIEAAKDKIILFRPGKQIRPEDITDHLFEVASLVKLISDAGSKMTIH